MLYNGLSALTVGSEAINLLDFTVTAKVAVKWPKSHQGAKQVQCAKFYVANIPM